MQHPSVIACGFGIAKFISDFLQHYTLATQSETLLYQYSVSILLTCSHALFPTILHTAENNLLQKEIT